VLRLVVADAVLLAVGAVYAAWVSRINRGSRINLFSGRTPPGRARSVGAAVAGVFAGGVVLGSAGYGFGTRWVNLLVFFAALSALFVGVQAVHNRAVDRR
jgi:hypothetical protein